MNWMNNRYAPDYKARHKNLVDGINRLYDALGIDRRVPDIPATRRYDLDKGRTIKLGGEQ